MPDSPLTHAAPLLLAENPVTPAVVYLTDTGLVKLTDANGLVSLTVQADRPLSWPQYFGLAVQPNGPAFDLSVIYDPPGGAVGLAGPAILEVFPNVSLAVAQLNQTATQISARSNLITVELPATLPTSEAVGFPPTTLFANTGQVPLADVADAAAIYLTIQAKDPAAWPKSFGVQAQETPSDPSAFNLIVVYDPSSGAVGVDLPVTVEVLPGASLPVAGGASNSRLIGARSFSQAADLDLSASALMNFDPETAIPVLELQGTLNGVTTAWNLPESNSVPQTDLLESESSDRVFVVETESDGTATLRFGDDTNGKRPESGTTFTANYRIGNGTAGNVGADSISHVASDVPGLICRNPLPAVGGLDPETNDQIRRRAPQAYLTQERAVTMADYQNMTEKNPLVDRAAATLRWTGSWYTVFVAVEPQGAGNLKPALKASLQQSVGAYRLAGQDLELDSPQYVSLEISLTVCVDSSYFRLNVQQALLQVLGSRLLPNGRKGLFYPDNFTFGQTVYLSPVYAAARSVPGVSFVAATVFQPQGAATDAYLNAGEIKLSPLQVARLDNDPDYPDHGQLTLLMEGGK